MLTIGVSFLALLALLLLVPLVAHSRLHTGELEALVREKTEALERELAEKRSTADELERQRRLLSEAEKIARLGSWEWDMRSGRLTWSDELFRIYGLERREFDDIAHALLVGVHPDDRERVKGLIAAGFEARSNPVLDASYRIIRPDGSVRILHVRGEIAMENGRPARICGACQDVTELKEAEAARTRLAAIIASSDDAVIGQSLSGTIVSWNKGAERIFGFLEEDIVNHSSLELHPADKVEEGRAMLESIRRGEREEHVETERVRRDGERIHVSLSRYPVRNEGGDVVGASLIARDITGQKRAQDMIRLQALELEEANRRLMELDRLKSEFVSNVSHELRTPIAAVKGATANILYGFLGDVHPEQREALEIIKRNVDRLGRLIENLLDLSRIESGALQLDLKPMDLRAPVKWAVNCIMALAKEKEVAIRLEVPDDPVDASADEDRIVQVVTNLVGNAIRFAVSEVRVALKREGQQIFVIVEDDGPGIPEDELGLIFERFYQVRKNAKRQGTGLGLAIVKGIVHAHGGHIVAGNRPAADGSGARFTVTLPVRAAALPDASAPGRVAR
jgi:PAS domain S-box-containing protein